MEKARSYVLSKLYGNAYPAQHIALDREYETVYSALRNTVVQKRGHQCILIGARATGKTMIIQSALDQLEREFPGQSIVIKINGLWHSDDKVALREVAKQLDLKITNGDASIEKPSMSQTLKSINELFDAASMEYMNSEDQNLRPQSVVFVVEELDRYSSAHQVLAYELFDLSQTSPIGVTVIGTSTRVNVLELLEKRNRSRNNSTVRTIPKPASVEVLVEIGQQLLANPEKEQFVPEETLKSLAEMVYYTTNSARHLASLLVPHVLGLKTTEILQPSTSELLLCPHESVPEIDWALLICAARAIIRYETPSVNLVIVLDEWRALSKSDHNNRFLEMSMKMNTSNKNQSLFDQGEESKPDGSEAKQGLFKPGSTPSSLLAVRHSWERLRKLGLLQPTTSQNTQEDLKLFVPEFDLDDLRDMLPRNFSLSSWLKID